MPKAKKTECTLASISAALCSILRGTRRLLIYVQHSEPVCWCCPASVLKWLDVIAWHLLVYPAKTYSVSCTPAIGPGCKMTDRLSAMECRLISAQRQHSQRQRPARASMRTSPFSRSLQVIWQDYTRQSFPARDAACSRISNAHGHQGH